MKSIYTKVSIQIVALFVIAIMFSFIPDMFHDFFGDWHCNGSGRYNPNPLTQCDMELPHNSEMHWGYRHWLWCFMGSALYTVQIIRIIEIINNRKD